MVIVKAPFRISLFGGGTDFPDFFNNYTGYTLSFAIDKYCYIQMRELKHHQSNYKYEIITHNMELENNINKISNPVIRECLRKYNIENVRVVYDADLPSRSGLGTSSSLAVAMIKACRIYANKEDEDSIDNLSIAKEAIDLERNILKEAGGYQDQIIAASGGFKLIEYYKENNFKILEEIENQKFINNLMLFDTGINRYSFIIQKDVIKNFDNNYNKLNRIKSITKEAYKNIINNEDDINIGKMLDSIWENKKKLSKKISNNAIDEMYKIAKDNGALGGKILGAGGGGYLLLYVTEENKSKVRKALKDFDEILFKVSNIGVKEIEIC